MHTQRNHLTLTVLQTQAQLVHYIVATYLHDESKTYSF